MSDAMPELDDVAGCLAVSVVGCGTILLIASALCALVGGGIFAGWVIWG